MIFYFICVLLVSQLLCFLVACVFGLLSALYFLWMGSHPYFFIYKVFFSFFLFSLQFDSVAKLEIVERRFSQIWL